MNTIKLGSLAGINCRGWFLGPSATPGLHMTIMWS
jgi:hypothetical protein